MSQKNDGGQFHPGQMSNPPHPHDVPGITRRNKLIDDLVVGMVAVIIDNVDADKDTAEDVNIAFDETIKIACKIADKTIAESNK